MTKGQLERGGKPSFAVFKFLCYNPTDRTKKAIMRVYLQIAIPGTESSPEIRKQQAGTQEHPELEVLKDLAARHCTVVPSLLAYMEDKQGDDGEVSDRYVACLVWDKVPGSSRDAEMFWDPKSAELREYI